jgi:hypothetical protein
MCRRLLPLCGLGWLGARFSDGAFWNSGARVEENAAAVAERGVRGWKWNGSGRQHSAAGHMAMRRTGLWGEGSGLFETATAVPLASCTLAGGGICHCF